MMRTSGIPTPVTRRTNPANIQSRHHQLAATQRCNIYDKEVVHRTIQAFKFFEDKCIVCWMQRKDEYDEHASDNCRGTVGNRANDESYEPFRKNCVRLPNKWCYLCLLHQDTPGHPRGSPLSCPWRGIAIRAIYFFTKHDIECPFLPPDVDVGNVQHIQRWLSQDPGMYVGMNYHNGLRLFLWLVYDHFKLERFIAKES